MQQLERSAPLTRLKPFRGRHNQRRLRELRHQRGSELELFCSHDVMEFERLSGRSARLPPEAMVRAPAGANRG